MAHDIICPECQARLHVPETVLGREVQCPRCSARFTAALTPAPTEAAAAEVLPSALPAAVPRPVHPAEPARTGREPGRPPARPRHRDDEDRWAPQELWRPSPDDLVRWGSVRAGLGVFLLAHLLYVVGLLVVTVLWLSSLSDGAFRAGNRGTDTAVRIATQLALLAIMGNWIVAVIATGLWTAAPAGHGARGLAVAALVLSMLAVSGLPGFIDYFAMEALPDIFRAVDIFGPGERAAERRLALFASRLIVLGLVEMARLSVFPFFLRAAGRGLKARGLATHGLVFGLVTAVLFVLLLVFNLVALGLRQPPHRGFRMSTLETIMLAIDLLVPFLVLLWGLVFLVGARITIGARLREM
jgi:predicted Zn finger-like uncharacterized protein